MTRLAAAITALALVVGACGGGDEGFSPLGAPGVEPGASPGASPGPSSGPSSGDLAPPEYDLGPYRGPGTWVDVFDFSPRFTGDADPTVGPADVELMHRAGVRTIFLQAARDETDIPGGIVEPELVAHFLEEAHERGMAVVAWYLPRRYDADDLRRLEALRDFRAGDHAFDGVAVDIEFRGEVTDLDERNTRLVSFSRDVRRAFGDAVVGAIVLPPVLLEVVNPDYWAAFPWRDIAPHYDVWLPMSYWTLRTRSSRYRDAYVYTEETVRRLRANLGDPAAVVHAIGGLGDGLTAGDMEGFVRAAGEHGAVGASIYDFDTSGVGPLAPMVDGFAG